MRRFVHFTSRIFVLGPIAPFGGQFRPKKRPGFSSYATKCRDCLRVRFGIDIRFVIEINQIIERFGRNAQILK